PNPRERRSAAEHDLRNVRQRLDVVDDSRQTEQPSLRGKGRLVARLAAIALDRVEDRRLFAADVRACAATDLDVEAHAAPEDVVAQKAVLARRLDCPLHPLHTERILAAYI